VVCQNLANAVPRIMAFESSLVFFLVSPRPHGVPHPPSSLFPQTGCDFPQPFLATDHLVDLVHTGLFYSISFFPSCKTKSPPELPYPSRSFDCCLLYLFDKTFVSASVHRRSAFSSRPHFRGAPLEPSKAPNSFDLALGPGWNANLPDPWFYNRYRRSHSFFFSPFFFQFRS